jgi:DNA-binding transcriptional LysR family regulator
VRIADLANEAFVLYYREGASGLYDTVLGMCNDAAFSPRIEYEPDRWQTVLSLIEAEEGVSLMPASVMKLWSNGVRLYRLQPDDVRIELVAAWKKEKPSVVLRSFLDLVDAKASHNRKKAELA